DRSRGRGPRRDPSPCVCAPSPRTAISLDALSLRSVHAIPPGKLSYRPKLAVPQHARIGRPGRGRAALLRNDRAPRCGQNLVPSRVVGVGVLGRYSRLMPRRPGKESEGFLMLRTVDGEKNGTEWISKVPQVTLAFWIIKICACDIMSLGLNLSLP